MTAAQRATLEQMADYAERFAKVSAERGDPNGASWHQDRADALRAALGTCGSCRHYNDAEAVEMGWGHCAAPTGHPAPFRNKLMPLDERCKGWEAHDA